MEHAMNAKRSSSFHTHSGNWNVRIDESHYDLKSNNGQANVASHRVEQTPAAD